MIWSAARRRGRVLSHFIINQSPPPPCPARVLSTPPQPLRTPPCSDGQCLLACRALGAAFLVAGTGLRIIVASYPPPGAAGQRRLLAAATGSGGQSSAWETGRLQAGADGVVGSAVSIGRQEAEGRWSALDCSCQGPLRPALGSTCIDHHNGPVSHSQEAWLTCGGYFTAQWIMTSIRATHYFSFDPLHHIWQLGRVLDSAHLFALWWAWCLLWPLPALFIALAAGAPTAYRTGHPSLWAVDV